MGAHRGVPHNAPENTLDGFAAALHLGVAFLECDVQLSRDEVPVIIHDFSLRRTTSRRGRVADKTWVELQALDAGGGAHIPSLGQTLHLVGGRAWLDIELKTGRSDPGKLVAAVARTCAEAGSEVRIMITSFDHEALAEAWRVMPQVPRGVLVYGRPKDGVDLMAALQADLLLPELSWLTQADVQAVHAAGGWVGTWVVNEPADWQWAAACDVDALISDRPGWALEQVRKGEAR